MAQVIVKLTPAEVELLLDVVCQSEIFFGEVEDCKDHYGMEQKAAVEKTQKIVKKLKQSIAVFG